MWQFWFLTFFSCTARCYVKWWRKWNWNCPPLVDGNGVKIVGFVFYNKMRGDAHSLACMPEIVSWSFWDVHNLGLWFTVWLFSSIIWHRTLTRKGSDIWGRRPAKLHQAHCSWLRRSCTSRTWVDNWCLAIIVKPIGMNKNTVSSMSLALHVTLQWMMLGRWKV